MPKQELVLKIEVISVTKGMMDTPLCSRIREIIHTPLREAEPYIEPTIDEVRSVIDAKNNAYKERDMLVSLISTQFPSFLVRHPEEDKDWEDDWRWIVFVMLPTGQASWHIHDSELPWFDHLERYDQEYVDANLIPKWDGHTTEKKYERVLQVMPEVAPVAWTRDQIWGVIA